MTVSAIDQDELFNQISMGMVLVTGNSRLARVLSGEYGRWRMQKGDHQWMSPKIFSWEAWLDNLWENAGLQGGEAARLAVPGNQQLVSLWQQVLREDPRARTLLRPESLATRLRDTRRLAVDWHLDLRHPCWFGDDNENHGAFQHWNRSFEALCLNKHWVAPEDRIAILCRESEFEVLADTDTLGMLGFDEFNPAQKALLSALSKAGHSVRSLDITSACADVQLWKSSDERQELQQMARWVRYWFEKEPASRIAVVVPDLQARRTDIQRHLTEVLLPGSAGPHRGTQLWNISMGIALARVPMVESAFDILRLLENRVSVQDVGRVLRSPWILGGTAERNSRALLEKCLRDNYPRQLKLSEVRYRASEVSKHDRNRQELPPDQYEARAWNSPVLSGILKTLLQFEQSSRGTRAPSAWAEALTGLLSQLGWPRLGTKEENEFSGERSENWQAFQSWQEGLRELASLDATLSSLGRQAAIKQLLQICREKIFQPRTPPSTIQVLGLYEASGLRFDHLWVMGLHNDNWPPAAQPNPFIPGLLQQKARLPHSSPQRELEVARGVTQRLLASAKNCVFSYPGQVDGEDVLPSPLLAIDSIEPLEAPEGWQGQDWQMTVAAAEGPRVDPLRMPGPPRHATARGGSSILKHQALCPFRAFASNRLGTEGLPTPVDGISPMLHGSLVHRVLENFWMETLTHSALVALDGHELNDRIQRHVDHVIGTERSFTDRPEFRRVEGRRLARLAKAALDLEKARDPFEVIGFEQEVLLEIEGQTIRLYIDRIDRLAGGGESIIDYKTGRVDPKKWFGSRPDDPQLPLYAVSAANTPVAIAFAVIRDDECLYRGVATREGIFPGLPPARNAYNKDVLEAGQNMQMTIDSWRQILHRLMAEYLSGDATIDPKNGRTTCNGSYCELQPLCRITELEQRGKLIERAAST